MLLLLYGLAETPSERSVIAQALGGVPDELRVKEEQLSREAEDLRVKLERELQNLRSNPINRQRFAEYAVAMISQPEVPLWLLNMMRLWALYRDEPGARAEFEEALGRLDLRLELLKPKDERIAESRTAPRGVKRVMICCPETKEPVFTGVELTSQDFKNGDFRDMEVWCPHCHISHRWNKADAFLESVA
jgi:hypothetical protein